MKRFLVNTGSLILAILLALMLADVVGVVPAAQPPIVCPDGGIAVWGQVTNAFLKQDFLNLSCRDAQGRVHGPNFNWTEGHLLGLSFWDHGELAGTTVTFHGNGRVWLLIDESAPNAYRVSWSESGTKEWEEIQRGDVSHFSSWHENGTLKSEGATTGESDPFWLPDGSPNEDRKDNTLFVGEYRSYFENGRPKDVGSYRNGVRDGHWICSDESGEHTIFATFSEGRLISRTGDVEAEHMKNRCKQSLCARTADDSNPTPCAANEEAGARSPCP